MVPTEAYIKDATVTLGVRTVKSDASGAFQFPNLPKTSRVRIDAPGYFLTTVPTTQQEIRMSPNSITITVKEAGDLFWNDEPITEATMQAQLRVAAQRTPKPEEQLRADKNTEYSVISMVMGDVKNAGIVHLGFISQAHAAPAAGH